MTFLDLDERKLDAVAERIDALGAHSHAVAQLEDSLRGAATPGAMRLGHDGVVALAIDASLAG